LLVHNGDYPVRMTEPKAGLGMMAVLSVMWGRTQRHFIVNEKGGKFSIEKRRFDSIGDLVRYYSSQGIAVTEQSGAQLLSSVVRQEWELRHHQIKLGKRLGEGAFGGVFAGKMTIRVSGKSTTTDEAVKVHKGDAMNKEVITEICSEARLMRRYRHPNVVRFYGVAAEQTPLMLVMELVNDGALDSYL
jgi:serine/threonine protein kinase